MSILTQNTMTKLDSAQGELVAIKIKMSDIGRTDYRGVYRTDGLQTDSLPTLCCTDESGKTVYLHRANEMFTTGSSKDIFEVLGTVGLKGDDNHEMMFNISDGVLTVREITKFLNHYSRAVIVRQKHHRS